MLQKNTVSARHIGKVGGGFLGGLIFVNIVQPNQPDFVIAALRNGMIVHQHPDSGIVQQRDHRREVMVSHDVENTVARLHVPDNAGHGCGGVFMPARQPVAVIPGQYAQVGFDTVQYPSDRYFEIQRPIGVEVAHVEDGISVECGWQTVQRNVEPIQLSVCCIAPPTGVEARYFQTGFDSPEGCTKPVADEVVFEFGLFHAPLPFRRPGL